MCVIFPHRITIAIAMLRCERAVLYSTVQLLVVGEWEFPFISHSLSFPLSPIFTCGELSFPFFHRFSPFFPVVWETRFSKRELRFTNQFTRFSPFFTLFPLPWGRSALWSIAIVLHVGCLNAFRNRQSRRLSEYSACLYWMSHAFTQVLSTFLMVFNGSRNPPLMTGFAFRSFCVFRRWYLSGRYR